ncbi:hypothetical protein BU16DRAFT_554046 [Lophium mytilinum]|uniref:Uncharacterized protein n=1 Tax=Lophium mytilinum TaxID=390894 RepID=A0A6A6RB07_9PEZI|nr:hypothetical protein BU16DRAFT_554046 [Lophium mytilinum]
MSNSTSIPPRASPLLNFLTQPGRYVPFFNAIIEHLGPADIIKLRGTSRDLGNMYSTLISTKWNINTALWKFFKHPKAFRNKLGETSGVISGQFALDFLDRKPPADRLDIWVQGHAESREEEDENTSQKCSHTTVGEWIQQQGYVEDTILQEIKRDAKWGYKMYRGTAGRENLTIHLHGCMWKNPVPDILADRSVPQGTLALVNIITATKIYAPFARDTFTKNHSYMQKAIRQDLKGPVGEMVNVVAQSRQILDPPPQAEDHIRSFSDGNTWRMMLDSEGIAPPAIPDFVTDATRFSVRVQPECYSINTGELEDPALRYAWAMPVDYFLILSKKLKFRREVQMYETPHELGYYDDRMPKWISETDREVSLKMQKDIGWSTL